MDFEKAASTARDEIAALVHRRAEAMRKRDADALARGLSRSAIVFEMVPPLRLPAEVASDQAAIAAWLESWEDLEVEIRDLDIRASAGVAFASSLNRLRGRMAGGRTVDMWMRSTLGLEKSGDSWTIVHAHTSVPFVPGDPPRAATNLQP